MRIAVKTSEELIESGLVSREEAEKMPRYFNGTVALIFPDKAAVSKFLVDILVPKVGRQRLISIWNCLAGLEGQEERWLLFKKRDFLSFIKQVL